MKFERKTNPLVGMNRPGLRGLIVGLSFLATSILFYIYSFFNSEINWVPITLFGVPGGWIITRAFFSKKKG